MGGYAAAVVAMRVVLGMDGGVDGAAGEGGGRRPSLLDPLPAVRRPPPEDPYRLRNPRDGTGELVYEETTFVARVAPDGTVRFKTKTLIDLHLFPSLPKRVHGVYMGVPSLFSSLKALSRGETPKALPPPNDGAPPPETTTVIPEVTRYRPDPREGCRTCGALPPIYPMVVWRLDLTDELMRLNGQDPYRYQKAKFLVATRAVRAGMAAKAHAENLRRGHAELPTRLLSIACDERLSARDRREILEALRAEMDTGTPDGQAAAQRIQGFLASQLGQPETCPSR